MKWEIRASWKVAKCTNWPSVPRAYQDRALILASLDSTSFDTPFLKFSFQGEPGKYGKSGVNRPVEMSNLTETKCRDTRQIVQKRLERTKMVPEFLFFYISEFLDYIF